MTLRYAHLAPGYLESKAGIVELTSEVNNNSATIDFVAKKNALLHSGAEMELKMNFQQK